MVEKEGLSSVISCDSAGIIGVHEGGPADSRMQKHANLRGYNLLSIARKFNPLTDFDRFDFIIGMDEDNVSDLQRTTRSSADSAKIFLMTDFCSSDKYIGVPDPYYGGSSGFELVLDLLEDGCENLLEHIKREI